MKKQSLTCGSCLYLEHDRIFEKKCLELGKLPSSKCCNSHLPNGFLLAGSEVKVDRLKLVSTAIRGMSLTEIQALAALLLAEKNTRKAGWKFYQRVVVRYTGGATSNFFNNFAVGYVVHADKDNVRIVSASGKMTVTAMNDPEGETVYTIARFKKLAAEMTRKGNFCDPNSNSHWVSPRPVSLDDALVSERRLNKKLKSSKTRTEDLVAIISRMSNGLSPTRPKKPAASRGHTGGQLVMDWRK